MRNPDDIYTATGYIKAWMCQTESLGKYSSGEQEYSNFMSMKTRHERSVKAPGSDVLCNIRQRPSKLHKSKNECVFLWKNIPLKMNPDDLMLNFFSIGQIISCINVSKNKWSSHGGCNAVVTPEMHTPMRAYLKLGDLVYASNFQQKSVSSNEQRLQDAAKSKEEDKDRKNRKQRRVYLLLKRSLLSELVGIFHI